MQSYKLFSFCKYFGKKMRHKVMIYRLINYLYLPFDTFSEHGANHND